MIYLITGKNGSGKTLYAMETVYKIIDEDGTRPVFSNIDGIKHNMIAPLPDDWRTCPDNSILLIDEAQHVKPFGKSHKDIKDMVLDLALHRKRGFDFYIMTPSARRLSADVLDLVHMHYHVKNILNNKHQSKIIVWDEAQMNTGSVSAVLLSIDKFTWRYPKHMYDEYLSAKAGHNKKMYVPKKLVSLVISLLLGLGIMFYALAGAQDSINGMGKPESASTEKKTFSIAPAPAPAPVVHDPLTPQQRADLEARAALQPSLSTNPSVVGATQQASYDPNRPFQTQFNPVSQSRAYLSGCMQIKNKCTCFTQQGSKLQVPAAECKKVITEGLPYNPYLDQSQPALPADIPPATVTAQTALVSSPAV